MANFREHRRKGRSNGREYVDRVFNAFCKAYPWWLPLSTEPIESDMYDEEALSAAVLASKPACIARLTTVRLFIYANFATANMLKGIQNFFEKAHSKADPITKMTKAQISKNPIASFLAKVGDVKLHRQRGRTAVQMFSSETFPSLRDEFNQDFAETGRDGKKERVDKAAKKARAAFDLLSPDEKDYWRQMALEDAAEVALGKQELAVAPAQLSPEATQE